MRYVYALIALGLLVALHELGHLVGARLLGLRVRRFSLGFGPPLLSMERAGIRITVGAIPFGGSVDVQGTSPHEDVGDPRSLSSRPPWQRTLFHLAGPLLNGVLAVLVLTTLYLSGTHVAVPLTVGTVEPGSEAARAGLRPGDRVEHVNELKVREWSVLVERVADSADRPLRLTVLRAGAPVVVRLTPRPDEDGAGRIGVSQQYVWRRHSLGESVTLAFGHAASVVDEGLSLAGRLLMASREAVVATPVAVFKQASDAATSGPDAFLRVLASLSLALAFLHLVPLPGLDGGRILFAVIAWATGRRVPARVETLAHAAGFVALAGLIVALGVGELRRMLEHRQAPGRPLTAPAGDTSVAAGVRVLPPLEPQPPPAPLLRPGEDAGVSAPELPLVSDLPP